MWGINLHRSSMNMFVVESYFTKFGALIFFFKTLLANMTVLDPPCKYFQLLAIYIANISFSKPASAQQLANITLC